jgi:hypothetical protein
MANISLDNKADAALSKLQDTTLTPMEEALFQGWAKANQIAKPDAPENRVDFRGIYKHTGGTVLPNGQLKRFTDKLNTEEELQKLLHERMMERIKEAVTGVNDKQEQAHKEERQDATHQQKMEMEQLKMKRLPHETKHKEMDLQKQRIGLDAQKLGNEAKQLDITKVLVTPQQSIKGDT